MSRQPDPWWVKIADFGISKRLEGDQNTTVIAGTPNYMAPELIFGSENDGAAVKSKQKHRKRDHFKADIWAVGCITHYMLTKQVPFYGLNALYQYLHGKDGQNMITMLQATFSDLAKDFVQRLLSVEPASRPTVQQCRAHEWLRSFVVPGNEDDVQSTQYVWQEDEQRANEN